MALTPIVVTPSAAAQAYWDAANTPTANAPTSAENSFGGALQRALDGAVQAGQEADSQATKAISGAANLTQVVAAVSKAELALQTTVTIRDRVVQAYQDIMKMPI